MIYPSGPSSSGCYYYTYECKYRQLKLLSTYTNSRKKLARVQNRILQFVATHCSVSSSDLSKQFLFSRKPIEYGNAKKYMRKLVALKLIERDHQEHENNHKNNAEVKYYYKLSEYGVYNLITNNENLPDDTLKSLLLNHKDHVLFGFFLFPYIKEETLLKIKDSAILSRIFSYLHQCCKQIEDMIYTINHTYNQKNGYLTDQLFIWDNIPKGDSDTQQLRNFLKQKFNWNWLDNAAIKKTEDGNGITISYELKSLLISMDKKRRKATLKFRGKKEYEFIVREATGQFIVEVPTIPLELQYILNFLISNQIRIPEFVVSLISNYGPYSPTAAFEILGQDKRFTEALKKTKNLFDKRYNLLQKIGSHCSDDLFCFFISCTSAISFITRSESVTSASSFSLSFASRR
jgi:hypothetical protein